MGRVIGQLVEWWRRFGITPARYPHVRECTSQAQRPELIHPRELVLVGPPGHPKWLLLRCPCGRGHELAIPIGNPDGPVWRLHRIGSTVTVEPSIDARSTYRCHFWLRESKVQWAPDQPKR